MQLSFQKTMVLEFHWRSCQFYPFVRVGCESTQSLCTRQCWISLPKWTTRLVSPDDPSHAIHKIRFIPTNIWRSLKLYILLYPVSYTAILPEILVHVITTTFRRSLIRSIPQNSFPDPWLNDPCEISTLERVAWKHGSQIQVVNSRKPMDQQTFEHAQMSRVETTGLFDDVWWEHESIILPLLVLCKLRNQSFPGGDSLPLASR